MRCIARAHQYTGSSSVPKGRGAQNTSRSSGLTLLTAQYDVTVLMTITISSLYTCSAGEEFDRIDEVLGLYGKEGLELTGENTTPQPVKPEVLLCIKWQGVTPLVQY